MLHGITVQLTVRVQTGADDPLGVPIYTESEIPVENVLVGEPSTEDIANELTLSGKRLAYTLAIPKGDTHDWTNTKVRFFGQTFRTFGAPTQGIESMIPLSWNKKVKVEHYGD